MCIVELINQVRPHFGHTRRPLSTVYKTDLYGVDEGLRGRNVLQSVAIN